MENIINKILEIDENARKKLENAQSAKSKIMYEAQKEEENIRNEVLERVSGRVSKIEEFEKSTAEEKISEIKANANKAIENINNKFEKNHKQWENEIFNKIISTGHKS